MLRIIKYTVAALSAAFALCLAVSAADTPDLYAFFYNEWKSGIPVHDGLAYGMASIEKDSTSGVDAVTVRPYTNASGTDIAIKHSSVSKLCVPFENVKYIRYSYYYQSDSPYTGRAMLHFPASEFNLPEDCTVYSAETLVANQWSYLTFHITDSLYGEILPGGALPEFMFYPFAQAEQGELSGDELSILQMYILAKDSSTAIKAVANGNLVDRSMISFLPGRADAKGTMDFTFAGNGETVILPECGYTRDGYTFAGWLCSVGSELYSPGDSYTVKKRTQNGDTSHYTTRTDFIAEWTESSDGTSEEGSDYITADYGKFWGGLVKPTAQTFQFTYADITKNYDFDGIDTLKLAFKPDDVYANRIVNLDGYTWNNLPLDIAKYKYLIIPYYFKTEAETLPFQRAQFRLLKGTTETLKDYVSVNSKTALKANTWAFLLFEFDIFEDYASYLNPNRTSTIINQCHFLPFGGNKNAYCSNLLEGDELYLGRFIFLTEPPRDTPTFEASFADGYGDGTFKPNSYMTNAEAAVMLAKAVGVADVSSEKYSTTSYSDLEGESYDWCRGYISFLESIGALQPEEGESFNPDAAATEKGFAASIIGAKSGNAGTDLAPSRLPVDDGIKLTRARAVSSIFTLLRESAATAEMPENVFNLFSDVANGTWFYNDITMASASLVRFTDSVGNSRYLNVLGRDNSSNGLGVTEQMYLEADEYLSSLDIITSQRISEIRNTASVYKQKPGGKTVYVSSTEGAEDNDGLSENSPILLKTLNDANSIDLAPGDVLLFKRGDTFRGSISAKKGVTYSAWGEGEKPLLTRSPEDGSGASKWELNYSDSTGKKIWKYYREDFVDAGTINLIDGNGNHTFAYKEVPSFINGEFWVRGNKPGEKTDDGVKFDYVQQLDRDLEFFHKADSVLKEYEHSKVEDGKNAAPDLASATGPIYLRCDAGNPGLIYSRIEFNLRSNCVAVGSNHGVTVDNLCIKYFGSHGIGAGSVNNLTVTNCEIGYGGGAIQNYQTTANYSNPGHVVRFGNGVEIYGGLVNYTIDNCYVYEIYDAGITHQVSAHSNGNYYMEGVYYTNNVLERCIYNIEYFMSKNNITNADGVLPLYERYMNEVVFDGNICRMAGYGWGVQRPDGNVPSNIKGSSGHNLSNNYIIRDNIFDRTVDFKGTGSDYTIGTHTSFESSTPFLDGNTFVQVPGRILIDMKLYAKHICNSGAEELLSSFGGVNNKVYFARDDKQEYIDKIIW